MVQVFFVMLFFPVIMNALQYYIIDGFIKDQKPAEHEAIPSEDSEEEEEEGDRRRRSRGVLVGDESEDEDVTKHDETVKAAELSDKAALLDRNTKLKADPKKLDEYDPSTDGDRGSSSGSSTKRGEPTPQPEDRGSGKIT